MTFQQRTFTLNMQKHDIVHYTMTRTAYTNCIQ